MLRLEVLHFRDTRSEASGSFVTSLAYGSFLCFSAWNATVVVCSVFVFAFLILCVFCGINPALIDLRLGPRLNPDGHTLRRIAEGAILSPVTFVK